MYATVTVDGETQLVNFDQPPSGWSPGERGESPIMANHNNPKPGQLQNLELNRETVQDLSEGEAGAAQGGLARAGEPPASACAKDCVSWTKDYCPEP